MPVDRPPADSTQAGPGDDRPTEDALIARHFAPLAAPGGLRLADDAALVAPPPDHDLVVTTDAIVAGVHYLPGDPPDAIAAKVLGVNVSDLAAKGADPLGFLLTLALPADWSEEWLSAFARGLGEAAAAWGCPLLGGDTVRASGAAFLNVAAFGAVPRGAMVARSTARAGDHLLVTGTIGDGALGLAAHLAAHPAAHLGAGAAWARALDPADRAALVDRYLRPRPRIALAGALRAHARAAMDVSDGFAGDLAKMLRSGRSADPSAAPLTARIEVARVPFSPAARAAFALDPALVERALTGGDDYEVLCAVPPAAVTPLLAAAGEAGIALTEVGLVEEGGGLPVFVEADGRERRFERGSYSHF